MTHIFVQGLAKGTPNGMLQVMTYGKQKGPQGHTIGHTIRHIKGHTNGHAKSLNLS